ncbi:MAG: MucR family transcriptional regulator [Alphaproteobacteria bacterium]
MSKEAGGELIRLTGEIVVSYVGNNQVPVSELPAVINVIAGSLRSLKPTDDAPGAGLKRRISVNRSVTPDYIVCMEDGRKLRTLKRHLRTAFGLTPEEYRSKWGLPSNYPMVAPSYAAYRSKLAKKIGLGRKTAAPSIRKTGRG